MATELLAPAGNYEAFISAIENKCDAVYLGGKMFGARAYSNNFSNEELKEMIEYAHLFNVKVYVTVNTIIFDDEFDELIKYLDFLYINNVDAIIVQDLGLAKMARVRYPTLELHASTQMNIHSLEQVRVLKDLGFTRVVLAREVSIEEIKRIRYTVDIELEVFVHGALCVSYSGNCYYSSFIGNRSGNRGRCAQPCRLEYKTEEKDGFLLSPKDLNSLSNIDKLIEAGVDSLKIEGRMKRPEYVAQVVKSYREAIEAYYSNTIFEVEKHTEDLKRVFNRGFTKGFLFNENNNDYINEDQSNHIGIVVGRVKSSRDNWLEIILESHLSFGDSIRIVGDVQDVITINQIYIGGRLVKDANVGDTIRVKSHKDGLTNAIVYLTTSYKQMNELKESYLNPSRKILISGKCYLENDFLVLELSAYGKTIKTLSNFKVESAQKTPVNDRLVTQFKKTSNTKFEFNSLEIDIERPIYINISEINDLRRRAIDDLETTLKIKKIRIPAQLFVETKSVYPNLNTIKKIKVKVRNKDQLDAVLNYKVDEIYVTDINLMKYSSNHSIIKFDVPRINNDDIYIERKNLVSGDLANLGDVSSVYLNITNAYAVRLLEELGVKVVGLSIELSRDQIKNLIDNYIKLFGFLPNLELMVYGKYELMMMKYSLLEKWNLSKNLVDRKNSKYELINENNTDKIMNSKVLDLKEYIEDIYSLGVSNILLDFSTESNQEVKDVLEVYINGSTKKLNNVTIGHYKEGIL